MGYTAYIIYKKGIKVKPSFLMIKRILVILAIIILLLALFGLSKQILTALQAGGRLESATNKVSKLQKEQQDLQKALKQVSRSEYIEQEARNKLNLGRRGETIVIIPQSEIERILEAQRPKIEVKLPNWQGWLNLIFH